mgnify:CR=1 FL=1
MIKVVACGDRASASRRRRPCVDEAPKPVKEGIEREEADSLIKEIQEAGGTAEIK